VILGGGVAVCLLLSAHRAVIFAIAQLSCLTHNGRRFFAACCNGSSDLIWTARRTLARCGASNGDTKRHLPPPATRSVTAFNPDVQCRSSTEPTSHIHSVRALHRSTAWTDWAELNAAAFPRSINSD